MKTGERFNAMLEDLGVSRNAFAGTLGMSSTAINGVVSNQRNPGHKILTAIQKKYPQYNTEWLLTGKGEMKSEVEAPEKSKDAGYLMGHLQALEEKFSAITEQLQSQLAVKDRQIEKLLDLLGKLSPASGESKEIQHPALLVKAA